ncbi:helix-turn-helix domain-containing protein [Streptomyces sp. NPDC057474]|uniref:helix-turn-helix domain-containing protein n=1 Tax=Streptomyces sp. NPDC057474 TaxID=3346144 RepID=UPI00368BFAAB
MTSESVSDVVGQRIVEVRKKRGLTAQQLAQRCEELGLPHLSAATISNIETGRRKSGQRTRNVTVDELLTLAVALGVAPVHLLVPPSSRLTATYWITPKTRFMATDVRQFICGMSALDGMNRLDFLAETPEDDLFQFTVMADSQQGHRAEYERLSEDEENPDRVRRVFSRPELTPDWVLKEGEPDWYSEGDDDGPGS